MFLLVARDIFYVRFSLIDSSHAKTVYIMRVLLPSAWGRGSSRNTILQTTRLDQGFVFEVVTYTKQFTYSAIDLVVLPSVISVILKTFSSSARSFSCMSHIS